MGNLVEVGEDNFEEKVIKSTIPVIVDFAAEWCPPCKILGPVVEEIAQEYEGKALVCHLDVDRAPNLAREYRVMSIPTIIFFKDGKPADSSIGAVPKQKLTEILDRLM